MGDLRFNEGNPYQPNKMDDTSKHWDWSCNTCGTAYEVLHILGMNIHNFQLFGMNCSHQDLDPHPGKTWGDMPTSIQIPWSVVVGLSSCFPTLTQSRVERFWASSSNFILLEFVANLWHLSSPSCTGGDGLQPFLKDASRGVWVLCKTSNPGAEKTLSSPNQTQRTWFLGDLGGTASAYWCWMILV